MPNTPVSIFVEIPSNLHDDLIGYLNDHPGMDQSEAVAIAIALFLACKKRSPADCLV